MPNPAVEAILAHGRRNFSDGSDLMRLHTVFGRQIRDAYLAGHSDGSRGLASREDAERNWQRSRIRADVQRQPPGEDMVGKAVICDDERALGREGWKIVAISAGQAWLVSIGSGDRTNLLVDLSTCRGVVSARRMNIHTGQG